MHQLKFQVGDSWRMDETYIKVAGKDRICIERLIRMGTLLISFYPSADRRCLLRNSSIKLLETMGILGL
jgi:transposase-like protein